MITTLPQRLYYCLFPHNEPSPAAAQLERRKQYVKARTMFSPGAHLLIYPALYVHFSSDSSTKQRCMSALFLHSSLQ